MDSLTQEKLDQATALLDEFGVDTWLTFVRESFDATDPLLPIIVGQHVTWQSAFVLARNGERIAIVGNLDADAIRSVSGWTQVIPYVRGISEPLRETLERLQPRSIAVNYSMTDVKADGLSHGMYLLLHEHLKSTPFPARLESAERLVAALRGRKTASEIARIRGAIEVTERIFAAVGKFLAVGKSEREVAEFMQSEARRLGVAPAWNEAGCPIVNTGPDSSIGHSIPSDLRIEPGHVVHIDFGVRSNGYCSDLQRCWYVPRPGESSPPPRVRAAFDATRAAILAAADKLRPGVEGWVVDEAARRELTSRGFPEYQHGTGHHVGRAVHDGGGILAPCWERYGQTPYIRVEANNVFTLELGVYANEDHGAIGLEEDVLVTPDGVQWLSQPQESLWLVH